MKQVRVLLFAVLREKARLTELEHPIDDGTTVGAVWQALLRAYPALVPYAGSTTFAVNHEYVTADFVLEDLDEVAFIPPVSGG